MTNPSLKNIAAMFTRYANLTFGGGSTTIAVLQHQIVTRRKWISDLDFQFAYALSRVTPGTSLLAFCTAIGWLTRRWTGAVVALGAASVPCSVIVLATTYFYEAWHHNEAVRAGLSGALAAAVAVMVNTAWVIAAPHLRAAPVKGLIIAPAAMALVELHSFSPFEVLLLAGGAGALWPAPSAHAAPPRHAAPSAEAP
ncbi:chromate transporter [Pendulispora albinea]|uniref:Chromate transporter n=1 Tax=Pendulispora albinea TaxID=2741071 RepID=A0ABZ2LY08_9BACT